MAYEWDEEKNRRNITAHGIDFSDIEMFEWELATFGIDDRHDYGELREMAKSFIGDVLHVVIYTVISDDAIRIISLRKATKKERFAYVKETQGR